MKYFVAVTLPFLLALFACLLPRPFVTGLSEVVSTPPESAAAEEVVVDDSEAAAAAAAEEETSAGAATAAETSEEGAAAEERTGEPEEGAAAEERTRRAAEAPAQVGPMVDIFGEQLYTFEFLDEKTGKIDARSTNEALAGKKVIGLYFSADWCGPCRQFTPELVSFYERVNKKKKDRFEIVWVSRCRDGDSYAQYFSHMPWLALPPEEAMGERGQLLGEKYNVKGIPSLVLIDEDGNTITTDARNKVPQDKAGVGFPWRDPVSQLVHTLIPRSLRGFVGAQIQALKRSVVQKLRALVGLKPKAAATA